MAADKEAEYGRKRGATVFGSQAPAADLAESKKQLPQ